MNILQITNKLPYPPRDGGAIATLNLAKGFVRDGHQVTIMAVNTSKHFYESGDIPAELTNTIRFIDVKIDTAINPFHALINLLFSRIPYNGERFLSDAFKERLYALLNEVTYDVIQIEGIYMGLYLEDIRKHSKALIAYRAHNIEHEIWERNADHGSNPLMKWYLKLLSRRIRNLERELLNQFDLIIPITQRDLEHLHKMGNTKPAHITPAGIDLSGINSPAKPMEYPSVFYIGALDWIPNQNGLLWFIDRVWDHIKNRYPHVRFYIAGRNAPRWFVNRITKHRVDYVGEIDHAQSFIDSKAIMVIPLFAGSGMRVKIIEGMAHQKAILTTSIGAEGIPVTHAENIFIANDEEAFITHLGSLIENKERYDKVAENAHRFVKENFDNFVISKALLDFYKHHL